MPIFACGSCQKRIKVPDSYAGKRVRCPGCSSAQRVPDVVNAAALDAFASLDAEGEVAARAIREILIGCGPCGKSIRIKEHELGRTTACPACGTLLAVDAFKLPKAGKRGGGLVDMSHLELEAADPLLGGRGFPAGSGGSTMGGTHVQLADSSAGASASGYALTGQDDPTALGGGAGDSQTQMRELRELNDLRHAGGVSDVEYKQRKKDIYAGKTLAIQAMSRSTDGSSNPAGRMPTGHDKPLLPGPVKALMALMVVGVVSYVLWDRVLTPDSGRAVAAAPVVTGVDPAAGVAVDVESEAESKFEPEPQPKLEPEPQPKLEPELESAPQTVATTEAPVVELVETSTAETAAPADRVAAATEAAVEDAASATPAEPEDADTWVVTEWPVRNGTQTSPDRSLPLGKACSYVMDIEARNGQAMAGVSIGPEVESMDDPAYAAFRDGQFEFIELSARAEGMLSVLDIERSGEPVRLGRNLVDRLTIEHKTKRTAKAVVLTMVQDGRAMAYWFEGQNRAYRDFVTAVGKAQLMSEAQLRRVREGDV